jgi:hypothetical protein
MELDIRCEGKWKLVTTLTLCDSVLVGTLKLVLLSFANCCFLLTHDLRIRVKYVIYVKNPVKFSVTFLLSLFFFSLLSRSHYDLDRCNRQHSKLPLCGVSFSKNMLCNY